MPDKRKNKQPRELYFTPSGVACVVGPETTEIINGKEVTWVEVDLQATIEGRIAENLLRDPQRLYP